MSNMINKVLLIIFFGLIFSFCNRDQVDSLEGVDSNKESIPEELYSMIEQCINCGCHWSFIPNKDKENFIRITKSYFSPDSTKALILVTHQINGVKNEKYEDVDFHIGYDPFIAFYENGTWTIYHYGKKMGNHYASYKIVEKGVIDFYEGSNYRKKVYVNKFVDGDKYSEPIGVSPNSPWFWDSDLWKKNVEVEGVYPFEITRTNVRTRKEKSVNQLLEENCK